MQLGHLEYRDLVVKDNQDYLDQLDSRDLKVTMDSLVFLVSQTSYYVRGNLANLRTRMISVS